MNFSDRLSLAKGAFSPVKKISGNVSSTSEKDCSAKNLCSSEILRKEIISAPAVMVGVSNNTTHKLAESSSMLIAYESLLKNQRLQILELVEKKETQNKKWGELQDELHKLKEQSSNKILELETILSMTKVETEERSQRFSVFQSSIMSDQIRLKGLILELSSRFALEASSSSSSGGISGLPFPSTSAFGVGGSNGSSYYQQTKAQNEFQENQKILQQINESYQRLERNLYELFRNLSDPSIVVKQETIDLFQTINQQQNQLLACKNKSHQKQRKHAEELSHLEKMLLMSKNDLAEAMLQKETIQYQLQQAQQQVHTLQREQEEWCRQRQEHEQTRAELQHQLQQIQQRFHEQKLQQESICHKHSHTVAQLQFELNSSQKEYQEIKSKYHQQIELFQQQSQDLSQWKDKYQSSQQQLQQSQSEYQQLSQQFQKELDVKHQYINQLSLMIKKLKEDRQREQETLQQSQQQHQQEYQQLQLQLQQLQPLQDLKQSFESQYQQLLVQHTDLQTKHDVLMMRYQQLERQSEQKQEFLQTTIQLQEKQLIEKQQTFQEQFTTIQQLRQQFLEVEKHSQLTSQQLSQQLTNQRTAFLQEKTRYQHLLPLIMSKVKTIESDYERTITDRVLKVAIPTMTSRIESLQRRIQEIASAQLLYRQEREEFWKSLLEATKCDHQQVVLQSQLEISQYKSTITRLEGQIHTLEVTLQQEQEKREELQQSHQQRLSQLDEDRHQQQEANDSLQSQYLAANQELRNLHQALDVETRQVSHWKQQCQHLEQQLSDLQQHYQVSQKKITHIEQRLSEAREQIQHQEEKFNCKLVILLQEQELLQQQYQQTQEKLTAKNQVIQELNNKYQKAKEKLLKYKNWSQRQDQEMYNKMDKFSHDILTLQLQLSDLNTVTSDFRPDSGEQRRKDGDKESTICPLSARSIESAVSPGKNSEVRSKATPPRQSPFRSAKSDSPKLSELRKEVSEIIPSEGKGGATLSSPNRPFDDMTNISDVTDDFITNKY